VEGVGYSIVGWLLGLTGGGRRGWGRLGELVERVGGLKKTDEGRG